MLQLPLLARSRKREQGGVGGPTKVPTSWGEAPSALIICDMWDQHHCVSAAARVAEMAPRMNDVVSTLRRQGSLVIHAPSSCMEFYGGTAARRRATDAPPSLSSASFGWNDWDPDWEQALPQGMLDPGPCSCDSVDPCCESGPPYPWTRQIETIDVKAGDAVSDDGREVFNLLEQEQIGPVLVMGVHTNLCVLGRPFGIRQLVYLEREPLLCRDLTDSFHRSDVGHFRGTELVVEHIERYWCPSITSDQLVGGEPFGFRGSFIPDGGSA